MGILDAPVSRESLAVADYAKLRPFWADLANRRNKRVDVLCGPGDSAIEGYSLTSWKDTLPAQIAAELKAQFPTYNASGALVKGGRGMVGIQADTVNQPFWPHAYTGGTRTAAGFGTNGRQVGFSASGHKFVHTVEAGGITGFYVHYALYSPTASSFDIYIDGVFNQNVSTSGSGLVVPTRKLVSAPVTSTIEIRWAAGTPFIAGIQELNGDENAGIAVHNCGWSGTYASYWESLKTASWDEAQALLVPSLIIINLGGNDGRIGGANQSAATFKTNLLALMATVKAAHAATAPNVPIVLNMQWSIGDSAMNQPWAMYVAAAKEIAAADARVVATDHSGTTASGRMYPSNTVPDSLDLFNAASPPHAKPKGYALEAATIVKELRPR